MGGQVDTVNTRILKRQQFACLGNPVLISVLPNPKVGVAWIVGCNPPIFVGVKCGKSVKTPSIGEPYEFVRSVHKTIIVLVKNE